MSSRFYDIDPSLENYWRGVILFGRNVASYEFALAKSLLELAAKKSDFIPLEELAEPFSRHLVQLVRGEGCSHASVYKPRLFLSLPLSRLAQDTILLPQPNGVAQQ